MVDDTYYRHMLGQMQSEFSRAVEALEKQVAALTRHNALLTTELSQSKQQQREWAAQAAETVKQLQQELEIQAAEAAETRRGAAEREEALSMEVSALKSLVQHETDYWTRYDRASREERDRSLRQLAEAKAEALQYYEQNKTLRREMKALQSRVETAVATSNSFEQRLVVVVKEKQERLQEMDAQLTRYRKKLHDKRVQKQYLTEALVRLRERQSSRQGSPRTTEAEANGVKRQDETTERQAPLRVRKRELTLLEEMKTATNVTRLKSQRIGSSQVGTSPTSSSPEISPRSARAAPYKRAPSVAMITPTASDGNSFNSSGSVRGMRSLRNVTGRRISSRNNSDSDTVDVSPRTNVARHQGATPTGRLERELSGLRRKLDSCMADTAARW